MLLSSFATHSWCVATALLEDSGCCGQLLGLLARHLFSLYFMIAFFLVRSLQVGGTVNQGPPPVAKGWHVTKVGPMRHSDCETNVHLFCHNSCLDPRSSGLLCCPRPGGPAFSFATTPYSCNTVHFICQR